MRSIHVSVWSLVLLASGCGSDGSGPCQRDSDCPSHACIGSVCGNPASCAALKSSWPSATDGSYLIDPDGAGGADPFPVWCNMTFDGGGWTALPLEWSTAALWSISHTGSACTDGPTMDNNGSLLSLHNGRARTMWNYLSMRFVPPISVREVWLNNLRHSTSTTCNNMDITYTVTPASTNDTTAESWYFAGDDPTVPLAYTFAAGCNSPGYSNPGSGTPECSMPRPGSDTLVAITRQLELSKAASHFHMVAVQGCGSDPPCNLGAGQAERFYINHPPSGGQWKDGILIR